MPGGLMQLVAYGAQDIYLTGNPQITFFKTVYRRHTNFAVETLEHPFCGNPTFGRKLSAKITRSGDLITNMYIRVILNHVDPECAKFAWVRRVGHALLRNIAIEIGGTTIDQQCGTWLDIWYELARRGDNERGYAHMIGDIPSMTAYNSCIKPRKVLYIPLQFWFNRFVGLAIPMIALQYHDVYLHVTFEEPEPLIIRDCNFNIDKIVMLDATILVDYVYLDTDERRRFAIVGHEYLIEQVQMNGPLQVLNTDFTYRLDFNHPVKELVWALKNGNYTSGKTFIYYSGTDIWSPEEAARNVIEKSISIGNDPTDIVGGCWYEVKCDRTELIGTFNVTNVSNMRVYVNPDSLRIGEYGITNKIWANVIIDNKCNIICKNIKTSLTIRDLSVPVEDMIDTRFNQCDPMVFQFNNYGVLIDGTINPVSYGVLKFNGHNRFDRREGMYFNYAQPEQHHTNTPADGINVYSFAIFPEEHQPSGTANFSRIERSDLQLWFEDSTYDQNLPFVNFYNKETVLLIFGTNYNILRVMAGLAGICYEF